MKTNEAMRYIYTHACVDMRSKNELGIGTNDQIDRTKTMLQSN